MTPCPPSAAAEPSRGRTVHCVRTRLQSPSHGTLGHPPPPRRPVAGTRDAPLGTASRSHSICCSLARNCSVNCSNYRVTQSWHPKVTASALTSPQTLSCHPGEPAFHSRLWPWDSRSTTGTDPTGTRGPRPRGWARLDSHSHRIAHIPRHHIVSSSPARPCSSPGTQDLRGKGHEAAEPGPGEFSVLSHAELVLTECSLMPGQGQCLASSKLSSAPRGRSQGYPTSQVQNSGLPHEQGGSWRV